MCMCCLSKRRLLEPNSLYCLSIVPHPPPPSRDAASTPRCFCGMSSLVSYDKHVTPNERVTDFRTFVSGVKANHLKGGLRLRQCQEEVAAILKDRTLVGHALSNDLKVCTLRSSMRKEPSLLSSQQAIYVFVVCT